MTPFLFIILLLLFEFEVVELFPPATRFEFEDEFAFGFGIKDAELDEARELRGVVNREVDVFVALPLAIVALSATAAAFLKSAAAFFAFAPKGDFGNVVVVFFISTAFLLAAEEEIEVEDDVLVVVPAISPVAVGEGFCEATPGVTSLPAFSSKTTFFCGVGRDSFCCRFC